MFMVEDNKKGFKMYTKLMNKRNATIKSMYRQGHSISFIAETFGIKAQRVKGIIAGRCGRRQSLVIEVVLE